MDITRRRIFPFDSCSVLLFTALSLGVVTASHAQGSQAQLSFGPASTTAVTPSKFTIGPAAPATADPQAAFDKADTNHDGKLSAQEAAAVTAIGRRFQQWDINQDGVLSRKEFEQGAS
ncbi:EF-hand domain-containing protein [Simplicispira psychrophila]|uniref:EF-hand domain-containing protein n=1 Tax=Simplicispira psychrophila TaxID=80882 RepID=UPI00048753A6|nr:EF-hand domain-containing protein [Simplicispira psychrophila]